MTDPEEPTDHRPGSQRPRGGIDPAADTVRDHWAELVADMEELAAEYREEGWTAHVVHPGDVTAITNRDHDDETEDREGFDVLAPDNEFDPIEDAVERGGGFATATVYRAMSDGVLFLLAVLEDRPSETAVLVPVYYSPAEDRAFARYLAEGESVEIHVRPLDRRAVVTFQHDDPSLFLPDE